MLKLSLAILLGVFAVAAHAKIMVYELNDCDSDTCKFEPGSPSNYPVRSHDAGAKAIIAHVCECVRV